MIKTCPKCGDKKDVECFALNKNRKDGRQIYCRVCKKSFDAINYQNDKGPQRERNRANRKKAKSFVDAYKALCPCPCGEESVCCLDFHHVQEKSREIAMLVKDFASRERLEEEMKKCVVICSNCHRKLHAKQEPEWMSRINLQSLFESQRKSVSMFDFSMQKFCGVA